MTCSISFFSSSFIYLVEYSLVSRIIILYFYDDPYRTLLNRIEEQTLYDMEHHKHFEATDIFDVNVFYLVGGS